MRPKLLTTEANSEKDMIVYAMPSRRIPVLVKLTLGGHICSKRDIFGVKARGTIHQRKTQAPRLRFGRAWRVSVSLQTKFKSALLPWFHERWFTSNLRVKRRCHNPPGHRNVTPSTRWIKSKRRLPSKV